MKKLNSSVHYEPYIVSTYSFGIYLVYDKTLNLKHLQQI